MKIRQRKETKAYEKRNHTVTIRMNKAEYDLFQSKVKESGRTQQEVVIKAIAELKIASAEEVEELKRLNQMFADILCQLRGATTISIRLQENCIQMEKFQTTVYYISSTKTNAFCLGIILCNVSRSFDYLIYPYYPAYTS